MYRCARLKNNMPFPNNRLEQYNAFVGLLRGFLTVLLGPKLSGHNFRIALGVHGMANRPDWEHR
jgi:hypothetical protein